MRATPVILCNASPKTVLHADVGFLYFWWRSIPTHLGASLHHDGRNYLITDLKSRLSVAIDSVRQLW